jgi:large subunit ribosomal protein L29
MKYADIKNLSDEQIADKIQEEQRNMQRLSFKKAVSSLENPSVVGSTRKVIARLMTEMNARKQTKN